MTLSVAEAPQGRGGAILLKGNILLEKQGGNLAKIT